MHDHSACPAFHDAVELIGRRWNGLILRELLDGPRRFSQVRAEIPEITDAMLSQRLKELEAAQLVVRITASTGPAHYELTRQGRSLAPVLDAIAHWSIEWARTTENHAAAAAATTTTTTVATTTTTRKQEAA